MEPLPISSVLSEVWKNLKIKDKLEVAKIWENWAELAGEDLAAHTKPSELNEEGKLFVNVISPTWADYLNRFKKDEILKKINGSLGREIVREIFFSIGSLKE
jgi:predicted nucleic acid-binding Zn ribbon protein